MRRHERLAVAAVCVLQHIPCIYTGVVHGASSRKHCGIHIFYSGCVWVMSPTCTIFFPLSKIFNTHTQRFVVNIFKHHNTPWPMFFQHRSDIVQPWTLRPIYPTFCTGSGSRGKLRPGQEESAVLINREKLISRHSCMPPFRKWMSCIAAHSVSLSLCLPARPPARPPACLPHGSTDYCI